MTAPIHENETSPLRRNRDFRLLWCGQVTSEFGANSTAIAVPLLVLSITGSAGWAGAISTIGAALAATCRLPGGAMADRWSRRRLMLSCDGGRLGASLVLSLCLLLGHPTLLLVLGVVSVNAILDVLFSPAETAAVSRIVPPDQLAAAFSGNEARRYAATLGGPPAGGVLYGLGPAFPFLADSVSYLISLITIAAIHTPLQAERSELTSRSFRSEIRDGITHVMTSRFLRAVVLMAAPLNFGLSGAIFTATVALRQAGASAGAIGLAQAAVGVGGLLGASAATWITRRLPLRRLVIAVCAALAAAVTAASATSGHLLMTLPLAAGCFLAPSANTAIYARLGASTPDQVQSRVISVVVLGASATAALAPLTCGLLISAGSPPLALLACAAALLLALLVALISTGLRDRPEGRKRRW